MRWLLPLPLFAACAADVDSSAQAIVANPIPDPPALAPPVHLMEANAFVRPTIPPYRTSSDGRLTLSLKKVNGKVGFGLYAPETLATPWIEAPAGVVGLAATTKLVTNTEFYAGGVYAPNGVGPLDTTDHRTICDAWPVANPLKNPYPCATDATHDCYDVTVVSTYRSAPNQIQLHGKPVRVEVANPKTATPTIVSVETNPAVLGPGTAAVAGPPLVGDFGLEPMITTDGHLLVMRLGDVVTPNPVAGGPGNRFDIVYLAADATDAPCDVSQWTAWWPVSHANHDPVVNTRYGFATYPLRDAMGVEFADGEDLGGSYPWIDRAGSNLFFTLISSTLWYEDAFTGALEKRYEEHCVGANPCVHPATVADLTDDIEDDEQFRGFAFAGLWSRGKTIVLDNIANNTDYGLGRDDVTHRMLDLYTDGVNPVAVRVGMGRANGGTVPLGAVDNTGFIDSWENLFNHDLDARPSLVRDVVWVMNTGKASVELAFDDYLDGDAIIISDGNAATSKTQPWATTNQPTYLDGFEQSGDRVATYTVEAELANAATPIAARWPVPASGRLLGNLRVEPIARGGFVGKGLWLPGTGQSVAYTMTAPVAVPTTRTISLMVDPRFDDDAVARPLLTFPDGTEVDLIGLSQVRYKKNALSVTVSMAALPLVRGQWNHLAWVVSADGNAIDLYRDGYRFKSTVLAAGKKMMNILPASGGTFSVGSRNGTGFRGWIDDVKVFARALPPESTCNLGHGTLVQLTALAAGGDPTWDAIANKYNTHGTLRTLLGAPAGTKFACFRDYGNPEAALLAHLPAGASSVRAELQFPEGPLHAAVARPDSTANPFCLGCHVTDGVAPPSLDVAALSLGVGPAQDDARRQPMQTPARIWGNVPLDFFRNGDPASLTNPEFDAPSVGTPIDPYVIP